MLYKIKYNVSSGYDDEEEVLIEADSEKEAVLQWFSDNYDNVVDASSDGVLEAESFTLDIRTMEIEKAKMRHIKIKR